MPPRVSLRVLFKWRIRLWGAITGTMVSKSSRGDVVPRHQEVCGIDFVLLSHDNGASIQREHFWGGHPSSPRFKSILKQTARKLYHGKFNLAPVLFFFFMGFVVAVLTWPPSASLCINRQPDVWTGDGLRHVLVDEDGCVVVRKVSGGNSVNIQIFLTTSFVRTLTFRSGTHTTGRLTMSADSKKETVTRRMNRLINSSAVLSRRESKN